MGSEKKKIVLVEREFKTGDEVYVLSAYWFGFWKGVVDMECYENRDFDDEIVKRSDCVVVDGFVFDKAFLGRKIFHCDVIDKAGLNNIEVVYE